MPGENISLILKNHIKTYRIVRKKISIKNYIHSLKRFYKCSMVLFQLQIYNKLVISTRIFKERNIF